MIQCKHKATTVQPGYLIPRLHDQANIKKTSSKHQANMKHALSIAYTKQTLSKHQANFMLARQASFIV